jgi:hypothetical protein
MGKRKNMAMASKKWTPAREYAWRCEQADIQQGTSKRLDAKNGYYRANKAERERKEPVYDEYTESVFEKCRTSGKKYIIHTSYSSRFSPSEKTGTVSDREFFKALYA